MALCEQLDEKVLLPTQSPHLRIEEGTPYLLAHYGAEAIPFLPRDVLLLPLANITVEALAGWFVEALLADPSLPQEAITGLRVRVSSGTEQWASRYWSTS
jgi:6-pyruvoyltetrahydropterin/6-carboxytetrahydropterin synthase